MSHTKKTYSKNLTPLSTHGSLTYPSRTHHTPIKHNLLQATKFGRKQPRVTLTDQTMGFVIESFFVEVGKTMAPICPSWPFNA